MQRVAVVAPHVAVAGQVGERAQGGRGADLLVDPAVHQLQQLDGELDVAQAAAAQLELALGLRRRDVVLDAAAHGLHLADQPPERGDHLKGTLFTSHGIRGTLIRPPALAFGPPLETPTSAGRSTRSPMT